MMATRTFAYNSVISHLSNQRFRYHKKCIDRLSYLERQANIANDGTTTRGVKRR